jgi:two-component system cell cycle response regulator
MDGKKILIIEDDEKNTKLMRVILEREGYRIFSTTEARVGIDMAREHRPFLILMDIQLPGLDGLSATRMIKLDPVTRDIPVVGVSAYAMEEDIEKALKAGCNGYITKPIDVHSFMERIIDTVMKKDQKCARPSDVSMARTKRILVVDDNPLNVKLFSSKLAREGYETVPAYDGREALARVLEEPTDIVLLDLMMPVIDGFEVLEKLKSNPKTKNIPVIVITALTEAEERLNKLEAKADELLIKPVSTLELLMRVKSMLHLREIKDQLDERKDQLTSVPALEYKKQESPRSKKKPFILIVEDEDKDAKLVAVYLADAPYKLKRARNGKEAFSIIKKKKADIILLDILLPDIDGFEICRRLKSSEDTKNIQIIAVTNVTDLEDREKSMEIGMDEYLIKPVNKQELRIRIKACLKRKAYAEQVQSSMEEMAKIYE